MIGFSLRRARLIGVGLGIFCVVAGPAVPVSRAFGQGTQPTPTPTAEPTPPPVRQSPSTRLTVPVRIATPSGGAPREATVLAGARVLRVDDARASVVIQGVERVIKVGDVIGTDIVKSISTGRIVLRRPASAGGPGGESLVILQFDPTGRTQVLLVASRDTTSNSPGTVK